MRNFWQWVQETRNWKKISEAVEQQKDRIAKVISALIPTATPETVQRLVAMLGEMESTLTDPEDIRKSATVSKFLKNFKANPNDSLAHTLDRFKNELQNTIIKANAKGKNPEQLAEYIRDEIKKLLPDESPEVIENLFRQVQQGARIKDVVSAYLAQKNAIDKEDRVILKRGNLELIEVNVWREGGTKEKHLDRGRGMEACHPLFKGTKWCVRFQDYFNSYAQHSPFYLVRENGNPVLLGHAHSPWLDVNDELPDRNSMKKIAPFIMESDIPDVQESLIWYFEHPVHDILKYIKMGKFKNSENYRQPGEPVRQANPLKMILGMSYIGLGKVKDVEVVELMKFTDMDNCLKGIKKFQDGSGIDVDLDNISDRIQEFSHYNNIITDEELVENLNDKAEQEINKVLMKRYERGDYGEIENFDDISFEEAFELDNEIKEFCYEAAQISIEHQTYENIIKGIERELRDGDESGFKVDTDNWILYIPVYLVDSYVREMSKDIIVDSEYNAMSRDMSFQIEITDIDLDFSSKKYNEEIIERIRELK